MKESWFIWKLMRNTLILGGGYLFSTFASFQDFSPHEWKPLLVFIGIYFFAELAHHYRLSETKANKKGELTTLIF